MGKWDKYKVTEEENQWEQYRVKKAPAVLPPDQSMMGNIFNRPGAAMRSMLRGQGYAQGAINPAAVPTFQEQSTDAFNRWMANKASRLPEPLRGPATLAGVPAANIASIAGMAADVATNPADILATIVGGKVATALGKTTAGKALGRFFTRPRRIFGFGGKKTLQKVAEKAGKGGEIVFRKMQDKYDDVFSQIQGGSTDITDIRVAVDDVYNAFPEGTGAGTYRKIANRLDNVPGDTMSVKDLQNLKQTVKKSIKWRGESSSINHFKKQVYIKINEALERIGGEKYKGLSREYAEFIKMMDDVNSAILERGLPGMPLLGKSGPGPFFTPGGGLSQRQEVSLRKLSSMLPSQAQFMQDFSAWQRAEWIKRLVVGILAGGALYGARRKVGETVIDVGGNEQGGY